MLPDGKAVIIHPDDSPVQSLRAIMLMRKRFIVYIVPFDTELRCLTYYNSKYETIDAREYIKEVEKQRGVIT